MGPRLAPCGSVSYCAGERQQVTVSIELLPTEPDHDHAIPRPRSSYLLDRRPRGNRHTRRSARGSVHYSNRAESDG